ncbi:MAG: IS1380 family transposase, partial [Thermodesulfobacteriota bacterium]|nr:IS1380 family transposase [Thermodesulfobacteriota bacterium]
FFYCMLISFFLFETFKEDVLEEVLPVASYATTVRRKAVDFAAKIVKTGGEIILKVTRAVMDNLRFDKLWKKCQNPTPITA